MAYEDLSGAAWTLNINPLGFGTYPIGASSFSPPVASNIAAFNGVSLTRTFFDLYIPNFYLDEGGGRDPTKVKIRLKTDNIDELQDCNITVYIPPMATTGAIEANVDVGGFLVANVAYEFELVVASDFSVSGWAGSEFVVAVHKFHDNDHDGALLTVEQVSMEFSNTPAFFVDFRGATETP